MTVQPARIRKLPGNYIASEVDGELILIHGDTGSFFSIRDVGLEIWQLLDHSDELDRLCGQLVEEYEIEAQDCSAQIGAFARELVEAGLAEYA